MSARASHVLGVRPITMTWCHSSLIPTKSAKRPVTTSTPVVVRKILGQDSSQARLKSTPKMAYSSRWRILSMPSKEGMGSRGYGMDEK